jgi:citrate lyase subunit beta/citryl-CoA lyase
VNPAHLVARSFLYVPGDQPTKLARAQKVAGDAIIADLEDGVAPANKDLARDSVSQWLATLQGQGGCSQVWVRINSGGVGRLDIAAVTSPSLAGVVLPKAEADTVADLGRVLDEAEKTADLPAGSVRIIPLIETARGIVDLLPIATSQRVARLAIGEVDLTSELGITASDDGRELIGIRTQLVVANAAAQLPPPIGPVFLAVRDLDLLRKSSRELRRLGFGARQAIHPAQVPIIEEAFTPTMTEIEHARELIASHGHFVAAGTGVFVTPSGLMVDEAVIRAARRIVALADQVDLLRSAG